jgi:hypothetical protein
MSDLGHEMPRFSIRDMLVSTVLIALGGGGLRILYDLQPWPGAFLVVLATWSICGGMIGAGVAYPFNAWRLGCAVGLLLHLAIIIAAGFLFGAQ